MNFILLFEEEKDIVSILEYHEMMINAKNVTPVSPEYLLTLVQAFDLLRKNEDITFSERRQLMVNFGLIGKVSLIKGDSLSLEKER